MDAISEQKQIARARKDNPIEITSKTIKASKEKKNDRYRFLTNCLLEIPKIGPNSLEKWNY